jgi:hypothetical protein
LLRGELPSLSYYDIAHQGVTATVGPILLEWVIGGLIIGVAMAGAVFAAASVLLRFAFASDASSSRMARATGDVD